MRLCGGTSAALLSATVKRGFLTPTGVLSTAVSHVLVWEMDLQCRRGGKDHFAIKKKKKAILGSSHE